MADYFPKDELKIKSDYLNIKKNGDYRMRFMGIKGDDQLFIEGWEAWEDYVNDKGESKSRPHRRKYEVGIKPPEELKNLDRNGEVQYFWMVVVWYEGEPVIYTIKQKTVMRQIIILSEDEDDYGDPRGYDIVVKRYEDNGQVKYNVTPKPPELPSQEMLDAVADAKIDLQVIWEGGQPFGALEGAVNDQENIQRVTEQNKPSDPNEVLTRIMNKQKQ